MVRRAQRYQTPQRLAALGLPQGRVTGQGKNAMHCLAAYRSVSQQQLAAAGGRRQPLASVGRGPQWVAGRLYIKPLAAPGTHSTAAVLLPHRRRPQRLTKLLATPTPSPSPSQPQLLLVLATRPHKRYRQLLACISLCASPVLRPQFIANRQSHARRSPFGQDR